MLPIKSVVEYPNINEYENGSSLESLLLSISADRRKHVEHPTRPKWETCSRKLLLFLKLLFIAIVSKIVKTPISLLNFYQKLSKLSQNFPCCVSRQKGRKNKRVVFYCFENYAKIMDFSQFQ